MKVVHKFRNKKSRCDTMVKPRPISDGEFNQLIEYLNKSRDKITSVSWKRDFDKRQPLDRECIIENVPREEVKFIITLYAKGQYTTANQIAALEHNTAAASRMEKGYGVKEKHI